MLLVHGDPAHGAAPRGEAVREGFALRRVRNRRAHGPAPGCPGAATPARHGEGPPPCRCLRSDRDHRPPLRQEGFELFVEIPTRDVAIKPGIKPNPLMPAGE